MAGLTDDVAAAERRRDISCCRREWILLWLFKGAPPSRLRNGERNCCPSMLLLSENASSSSVDRSPERDCEDDPDIPSSRCALG